MRLRAAWAIPWFLAVFLSALSTQGSAAQDDNLLVNGGFEDGTAGWWATPGSELTSTDAFVLGGSYAGKFATGGVAPGSEAEAGQCLPVAPSASYEFWGYAARLEEGPLTLDLRLSWYDQDNCSVGALGGGRESTALEEPGQWYELTVVGRSPATARAALVRVVVEEGEATVYLDDFSAVGPAAPTETPTLEPSPSPSSSPSPTPIPRSTPPPTATAQHRTPSPSATPRNTPTASSVRRTPVPATASLRNGGFEEGGPEGLPSFWRKYGGELTRTGSVRFEGQYAAAFRSATTSTKWVYQVVTVQGAKAYVLSAYALKDDPAVFAAYLRISWYASPDGSGQAIDIADSTERLTDDSPEFRFLTTGAVVAPAEAASAKTRLMLDPVGEAPGVVYFDAATFEETTDPEPTVSPTATPPFVEDEATPLPSRPAVSESTSATPSAPRGASTPAASAASSRSSLTAAGTPLPAALGATRVAVITAAAAAPTTVTSPPASTRAAVYRQRKTEPLTGDRAVTPEEGSRGGLSPELLALALAVPALASTGAGVYYWRWRRARLR